MILSIYPRKHSEKMAFLNPTTANPATIGS
jgi:hypothetical protein